MNQTGARHVIFRLCRLPRQSEVRAPRADHAVSLASHPSPPMSMSRTLRVSLLTLFGALGCAATALSAADQPAAMVRQIVIRAPKMPFVAAAMANPKDEAVAKLLWGWVADGKATVLSEIASRAEPEQRVNLTSGKQVHHVTGNNQDIDRALLIPAYWDDVFVGTSCEFDIHAPWSTPEGSFYDINLAASYSPRDEENVPWPVWWPPNPATKPNWYQQKDFFYEKVTTASTVPSGRHRILAFMRRADQLEPDPLRVETLDIILVHIGPTAGKQAPPPKVELPVKPPQVESNDPFSPNPGPPPTAGSMTQRCTVLTFGVGDREAVALLSRTGPHRDKELLEHLLKESAANRAPLRDVVAVNTRSGQRATVESARRYSYPTEMPTIPSAWEEYPSGTRMEMDPVFPRSVGFALDYHPVPPRRAIWRCALDTPDLFMVRPQFITRSINTQMQCGADGVALVGVMRTPDCALGLPGLNANETLVMMARLDGGVIPPEDLPSGVSTDYSKLELEAVVFDVPATEAAAWPEPRRERPTDDSQRFAALLARVDGKQVKIAAHVALGMSVSQPNNGGGPCKVSAVERVLSVAETENNDSPIRYRPTAMYENEVGTTLEAEATYAEASTQTPADPFVDTSTITLADTKEIRLSYSLHHDVAMPQEPDYRDMIASLDEKKNPDRDPPPAAFFQEVWKDKATVKIDSAQFIGARTPPGDKMKGRLHVAFVRARVLK